jgi:hypothetical protein
MCQSGSCISTDLLRCRMRVELRTHRIGETVVPASVCINGPEHRPIIAGYPAGLRSLYFVPAGALPVMM